MVRGIERTIIFLDDTDRADFLARLASLAESGALTVYAWALLPNHAHILGTVPLRHAPPGSTRPAPSTMRWCASSNAASSSPTRRGQLKIRTFTYVRVHALQG